jgi:hypothetical protein
MITFSTYLLHSFLNEHWVFSHHLLGDYYPLKLTNKNYSSLSSSLIKLSELDPFDLFLNRIKDLCGWEHISFYKYFLLITIQKH